MSVKTKRSHEFCTGMLATSSRVAITDVENLYQSSVQIRHLISTLWLNFGCEECKRPQWDFSGYQQLFKELKCWLKKKRGKNKKSAALHTKSDTVTLKNQMPSEHFILHEQSNAHKGVLNVISEHTVAGIFLRIHVKAFISLTVVFGFQKVKNQTESYILLLANHHIMFICRYVYFKIHLLNYLTWIYVMKAVLEKTVRL